MQCFIPKSNTFPLSVKLLDDAERLFKIPVNQKASVALCQVAKLIPVAFIEYFGLKYFDRFQKSHWINPEKSLYKQLKKSQIDKSINVTDKNVIRYTVLFEVRYYPRDPTSINDEDFRYQLFLQIRKDLSSNKLTIKDERIVAVLCALILQSDFGDYDSNRFAPHYIRQTISNHLLTPHVEDQIKSEHIKLRGLEPIDAEYQFLEKARWLENYGTVIFPVKDDANRNCYLGLNPQGFALRYYKDNNLKCDIFWPRICGIRRRGRQFVIKEKCETTVCHRFETGEKCLCKVLHKLSLEHYAFFKLKKDDKPLVKEPTKRGFGKSASREFGYSSDTSDNNQLSDDTFSSYPDSINTTQSTKMSKGYKKAVTPIRNCVSDVEESAFSKKNRKVIVCKSQTETEDEIRTENDESQITNHRTRLGPYVSHERIPADFIYENRLNNPQVVNQTRQKRFTKRVPINTGNERKFHGHREMEPYLNKTIIDPPFEDGKYQIPFKSIRTREAGYHITRSKSGDGIENKARFRRKLPSTELLPPSNEVAHNRDYRTPELKLPASTSVDSIIALRPKESPSTKRLLPNITSAHVGVNPTPPIPKHRPPPNQQIRAVGQNRPQSLFTNAALKPAFANVPPRIPVRTSGSELTPNEGNTMAGQSRMMNRSYLNYTRRSIPETGI